MPSELFSASIQREMMRLFTTGQVEPAQGASAPEAAPQELASGQLYGPDKVIAFVDLENIFNTLKLGYGFEAAKINLPALIRGIAKLHGLPVPEIRIFTGLPDPQQDRIRFESKRKRIHWMTTEGAQVFTHRIKYYYKGGERVSKEKGVDVSLAMSLQAAVFRGLRHALVVSHDRDFVVAVKASAEVARADHANQTSFTAYSLALPEDSCLAGTNPKAFGGLTGTTRLEVPLSLVREHISEMSPKDGEDRG